MNVHLVSPEIFSFLLVNVAIVSLLCGVLIGLMTKKTIMFKQRAKEFEKIIESEKQARAAAEEAIKARDEFLSIASHELKTPLTTITLRIQSTLDSILNNTLANFSGEKLVGSLNVAHEQTRRLQMLIKDLLDFSLITRGKLDLQLKEADLTEIVKSTIERFEDHLELAGCSLKLETEGAIKGMWDQIRIEQALSNLLTNAIKYGEGEPIEVSVKKSGDKAEITVRDNGIGIDSKLQKEIFGRFQRATEDKKFQGLGVGLFIVKQIIDAHGGKVSVKSKLGKGSTFIIELPIIDKKIELENTELLQIPQATA